MKFLYYPYEYGPDTLSKFKGCWGEATDGWASVKHRRGFFTPASTVAYLRRIIVNGDFTDET